MKITKVNSMNLHILSLMVAVISSLQTTRPETILGDGAVAVHLKMSDKKDFIGKRLRHPILGYEFPIVADPILVDPEFGTGAVKVTPAHDFNDFETGKRHNLTLFNIFDENACVLKKILRSRILS